MRKYDELRVISLPITNALHEPEDFRLNPDAAPGSVEGKPLYRLKDLYPNIADYRTIDTERFISPEVVPLEWDKLWTKTWLFAGRANDIPDAGDWFRYDIGRESFIIVRGAGGEIKAYYNACRHRGRRLVNADFGKGASGFGCSFHSWRWDINGKNTRITDPDTFQPEALCGTVDLIGPHCEVWAGFVFINMAEKPEPLSDFLGDLTHFLAPYEMEKMYTVKDVEFEIPANWKVTMDAFQEIYHLHVTHPQGKLFVDDHFVQYDFYKNGHNRMLVPFGLASPRMPGSEELNPAMQFLLSEVGIDPATYTGTASEVRRALQQAKRKPDNPFGLDYSRFTDDQTIDDWNVTFFPGMTLNTHPEGVLIQRFRPHVTDPDKSLYDIMVIMPSLGEGKRPPAYMGLEPDVDVSGKVRPARRRTTNDNPEIGELLEQDVYNIPSVQQGLHSRGMQGIIRLSEQERRIQQFHAELDKYMKD